MAIAAAISVLRSSSAHSAASRFASQTKPACSPFRLPIGTPLAQCLSRSPVEMSACVVSLQPHHTATASALMMSMLTVSRCGFGWLPGEVQAYGVSVCRQSYPSRLGAIFFQASLDGFRSYSTTLLTPNSSEGTFPSHLLSSKKSVLIPDREIGLCQDLVIPVTNFLNEDKGFMTLAGDVFDVPIRKDIIHRVVRWQLAKRRQGTHSTKSISEVSGTGRKPWPQKGTGRARHGSLRGPQFRGGAVMHGPKPRSHAIKLNKKVRRLGLKIALSARAAEGKLMVFEDLEVPSHKTKNIVNFVSQMENAKKILVVDGGPINEKLKLSTQNLHYVNVLPSIGLNVYSILLHDTLVMSRDAVNRIVERMRTPINR